MRDEIWHLSVVLAFCGAHLAILSFVVLRISSVLRRESRAWSPSDRAVIRVAAWTAWLLLIAACILAIYYRFHDQELSTIWLIAAGLGGVASSALSSLYARTGRRDGGSTQSPETRSPEGREA